LINNRRLPTIHKPPKENKMTDRVQLTPESKAKLRARGVDTDEMERIMNGESTNPEVAMLELAAEVHPSPMGHQSSPHGTNSEESLPDNVLLKALRDI
jgi:hypothetical protein